MSNYNESKGGFDARTIIAIVLMVIVITVGMAFQDKFFPKNPLPAEPVKTEVPSTIESASVTTNPISNVTLEAEAAPSLEEKVKISTAVYDATFSNKGGELISLKLKEHNDKGNAVEMLTAMNNKLNGFCLSLGSDITSRTIPLDSLMNISRPGDNIVVFSASYVVKNSSGQDVPFNLKKRYEFRDDEYMFKLSITIEGLNGTIPTIGDGTYAYSLDIGPQIGPSLEIADRYADWRKIYTYENGKRKGYKQQTQILANSKADWAAIAGKYFAIVVLPENKQYSIEFKNTIADQKPNESSLSFSRPNLSASAQTDTFYIYAGPKSAKELARYNDPTANGFKHVKDDLEGVMESSNILGWLEVGLKWCLNIFYTIVGNYGVAIILLTLLVRLILFPLTFKGSKATARMQELQPKMQAIQEKHKNNPQKLNEEMAAFYKTEGYNPMSGCLPTLIQFPIFIAMYGLFNNHFDLRGASFIAGWINDLSLPEAIVSFPTVNLLIWQVSAVRLLPIIYLLSQLLYGKLMQQPGAQGNSQNATQMKLMMYGMPIVFFFVLYNVPSGLLVYWIASNILTAIQQIIINRIIKKKDTKIAIVETEPKQKVLPPKAKGKKK